MSTLRIINTTDFFTSNNNFNLTVAGNMFAFNVTSPLGRSQLLLKSNAKGLLSENSSVQLFTNKKIRSVIGYIRSLTRQSVKGYFLEIIFFGINYNFKRFKARVNPYYDNYYRKRKAHIIDMELHFAKKLRLRIPEFMFFRVFKRRIMVFSYLRHKVISFYNMLKAFRKASPYTWQGYPSSQKDDPI